MERLHIEFTLFSAFYAPLIATMSGGFLRQQGIDATWSVSQPGKSAIESVLDGSAQVIQTAPSQSFNWLKKGETPPVTHFAQINEMDGFFISGREPNTEFDWKNLEGAEVVMFKAGQPNAMFQYACHKAGIDYSKIIPVTPGGAAAIDQAFREGQGQFVQQQGPYPQQLEIEGLGHIVAQSGPLIGPNAFSSLASTPEWLETEQAGAFLQAYRDARRYLNTASAREVAEDMSSFFPEVNQLALAKCIAAYQQLGCWSQHIEITETAYEVILDVFAFVDHIDVRYDYAQVCTAIQ